MQNGGFENGDISCNASNLQSQFTCSYALNWNSADKFASPGNEPQSFTLYFPKFYVNVEKIKIKDGFHLRYLNASVIDSSLDGINYKKVMDTNIPFCNQSGSDCNCVTETIRDYVFPEERILKYLRITGVGKVSCGTSELSFVGIEVFGNITSFCKSINKFVFYSFPLFALSQFFVIFE